MVRCAGEKPDSTIATGVVGRLAVCHQLGGRPLQPADAHEQHQRAVQRRQRGPVEALVTGGDGDLTGPAAVGDRDAGLRGHRDRTRHARDDLDGDVGRQAGQRLLAAPAQHERVTALQTHHPATCPGVLHQEPVDLLLRQRVVPGRLADVDDEHRRGPARRSAPAAPAGRRATTSASASSRRPRTLISPGSPGPPPTRATHPAAAGRWWRSGRSPESRASATASRKRGGAARVAAGGHRDGHVPRARDGRRPGSRHRRVVGPDAPDAGALGVRGDQVVGSPGHRWPCGPARRRRGRRRCSPGPASVTAPDRHQVVQVLADPRRDQHDVGPGRDERCRTAGRPPGRRRPRRPAGRRGRAPAGTPARVMPAPRRGCRTRSWPCRPSGRRGRPRPRPVRRVQGKQPTEAKPSESSGLVRMSCRST